jgi:putative ABC transport system permease protein
VGVVSDAKHGSVWDAPEPLLYLHGAQWDAAPTVLLVRTGPDPRTVSADTRRQWPHLAPGVPLLDVRTGEGQLKASLAPQRVVFALLACLAALAAALASIGLFARVAFDAVQRTREIGIRLAVGARPSGVVSGILRRTSTVVGVGILAGTAASVVLMRALGSVVRGVPVFDGLVYAVVALLLAAAVLRAALVPASRAARVDPLVAWKCE